MSFTVRWYSPLSNIVHHRPLPPVDPYISAAEHGDFSPLIFDTISVFPAIARVRIHLLYVALGSASILVWPVVLGSTTGIHMQTPTRLHKMNFTTRAMLHSHLNSSPTLRRTPEQNRRKHPLNGLIDPGEPSCCAPPRERALPHPSGCRPAQPRGNGPGVFRLAAWSR